LDDIDNDIWFECYDKIARAGALHHPFVRVCQRCNWRGIV